jgi:cbb3-type cytochrome oxidase subunit 3
MFKHINNQDFNNEYYAIISLLVFVLFFLGVVIYTYTQKNKSIDEMKNIPFADDFINVNNNNQIK